MTEYAHWHGDMLWPSEVTSAPIINCEAVQSAGSWLCAWFREHPKVRVVGAPEAMKTLLQSAGLSILWYDSFEEAQQAGGVTPSERAMLWS